MKLARWIVPVISLLLVVAFTWWDLSRSNAGPGPLHPAHAAVASLQGGANCAGCHRDGAVSSQACLDCHVAIARQATAQSGLHATLTLAACATCHPEHHGAEAPLLPPHAFERAGILDVSRYDHRHVAFALNGVHSQLTCVRCHDHADDVSPPTGGRYLGASQACTSCHEDVHQGAYGSTCVTCHGQSQPFQEVPGFSHDRFALIDAHGQVPCAACHEPGSDRDVEREQREDLTVRSCRECHSNPHEQPATGTAALYLPKAGDCARCHEADRWDSARPTAAEHGQLGFALHGQHAQTECASCHGNAEQSPLWQGQAPKLEACAACHESPHAETVMLTATDQVGPANGCAQCHLDGDQSFAEGRMNAEQHRATGFLLATPHADLACNACHQGANRAERFLARAASDCRSCHADSHAGQFREADVVQQCTECHHADRFLPHRFGTSMHAESFALTGAHDAVACTTCHDQVVAGVRQFVGTKRDCKSCHDDIHRGRFDEREQPSQLNGREGCARCHDTNSFQRVRAEFDHALWTGYALAGAHQNVACAQCHDRPAATRLGSVVGKACADCHVDRHAGQFRIGGATDCRRCHDATAWAKTSFDHQRDSRFPLDDVHKQVACAKCHATYEVGKKQLVRYKPLGTRCGDCHKLGNRGGR